MRRIRILLFSDNKPDPRYDPLRLTTSTIEPFATAASPGAGSSETTSASYTQGCPFSKACSPFGVMVARGYGRRVFIRVLSDDGKRRRANVPSALKPARAQLTSADGAKRLRSVPWVREQSLERQLRRQPGSQRRRAGFAARQSRTCKSLERQLRRQPGSQR